MIKVKKVLWFLSFLLLCNCESRFKGKTVESVGGCNHRGRCGVKFTDGTICELYFPVPGQVVGL